MTSPTAAGRRSNTLCTPTAMRSFVIRAIKSLCACRRWNSRCHSARAVESPANSGERGASGGSDAGLSEAVSMRSPTRNSRGSARSSMRDAVKKTRKKGTAASKYSRSGLMKDARRPFHHSWVRRPGGQKSACAVRGKRASTRNSSPAVSDSQEPRVGTNSPCSCPQTGQYLWSALDPQLGHALSFKRSLQLSYTTTWRLLTLIPRVRVILRSGAATPIYSPMSRRGQYRTSKTP